MPTERVWSRILHLIVTSLGRWVRRSITRLSSFFTANVHPYLEKVGLRQATAGDDLSFSFSAKTADWVVIACFTYRAVVSPFTFVGVMDVLGDTSRLYFLVLAALMAWNVFLAISVSRPRLRTFLATRTFIAVDLSLAACVNIWGASVLEAGTLFMPYRDVFWIYAMGTVAAWTALKGARMGLLLCLAGGGVLVSMAAVNGASISGVGLLYTLARFGWLLSAVPIPVIIMRLAGQGAGLGSLEGRRAGRALQRSRALRAIHDTVLQTLAQIAQRAVMPNSGIVGRAQLIHQLARQQLDDLDRVIRADDHERSGLTDGLQSLVRQFAGQGLHVDLVTSHLASDPPYEVSDGLLGATREALTNVKKYAGVRNAFVEATMTGHGYEVVIQDNGCGFDAAASHAGVGISESMRRRVSEIGGRVEIWSKPGHGTTIRLAVDYDAAKRVLGVGLSPSAVIPLSGAKSTSVDALTNNALSWFVVAALAYRVILSPLQLGTFFANIEIAGLVWFLIAYVAIFIFDLILLMALLLGRLVKVFKSRWLLVADLSLTAGLNVWSSLILPDGTALMPGHDILWGYTLGVAAFWTGLRGFRTGLAVTIGGFVLQIVMALFNHTSLTADAWLQIASRQGWLTAAFVISWLLTRLARKGAQQAVDEGIRAGLEIEQAWILRDVYENVRASLKLILSKIDSRATITPRLLKEIRGAALGLVERLRESIEHDRVRDGLRLGKVLARVAGMFRARGIRVEIVSSQLSSDPPHTVLEGMIAATKIALSNAEEHASVSHVVLRIVSEPHLCEIVIRDHGAGFESRTSSELRESNSVIHRIMAEVGGYAEIWSEPGSGTRVRLHWQPNVV